MRKKLDNKIMLENNRYILVNNDVLQEHGVLVGCALGMITARYISDRNNNKLIEGYSVVDGVSIRNKMKLTRGAFNRLITDLSKINDFVEIKHKYKTKLWRFKIVNDQYINDYIACLRAC